MRDGMDTQIGQARTRNAAIAAFVVTAVLAFAWLTFQPVTGGVPACPSCSDHADILDPWRVTPLTVLAATLAMLALTLLLRRMRTAALADKGALMIALPLVLVLIFVGLVAHLKRLGESAQAWKAHSATVVLASNRLVGHITEAESAARGYLLTRQKEFLDAYEAAAAPVAGDATTFRSLVSDNTAQLDRAGRIARLSALKMARLAQVVQQDAAAGAPVTASEAVGELPGPQLMSLLRSEMQAFSAVEAQLAAQRERAVDTMWQRMGWVLAAGCAGAVLLALLLAFLFRIGISRRLQQVRDNAINLASGSPLPPPLAGNDEMAELDRVFHGLAESAAGSAARELAERRSGEARDDGHSAALLKTGALQRAIFNSANFSSIATDEKGVIQIFNVGAERMLGYAAAEVMNRITPADISDPQEVIARAKALSVELGTVIKPGFEALVFKASRGIEDIYELTYIRKDGTRFPAVVSVTALRDADGTIIGYLLIGTDNTARKKAEEALLQAGALQSAIFNSANFSSIATDAMGVIQIFNVGAERMLGYSAADVLNRITPADISDPQELIARARALSVELGTAITPGFEALVFKASRGIEDIYELTYIRQDGTRFPAMVSVTALRDPQASIIGYLLIGTDNTARKEVEANQALLDQRVQDQQRALQEKNLELEHASKMKSEFLATMSHELRTPLNAIIGFSEALKDGLMGEMSAVQQEYIGDIFSSGQHLLSLINDILDLSKVEAGMMTLELDPVDLRALLQSSLSIVKEKAAGQSIKLQLQIEGDLDMPSLDVRKTKQIVYNLLSNAVKFSPSHADVTLSARIVPRTAVGVVAGEWPVYGFPLADGPHDFFYELCVTDGGIGISAGNMAKLFQAFSQIDSSLSRKFEGTGLGLAMVRQLAELHGGTVAVASRVGEGARFAVWLPVRKGVHDNAGRPVGGSRGDMLAGGGQAVRANAFAVLVVDDDPMALEVVTAMLPMPTYAVVRAHGGAEAIALAQRLKPDLILLDLMMPEISGLEVALALQHDAQTARIPLLAVTAKEITAADRVLLNAAAGRGIEIIGKPGLNGPDFLESVRRALNIEKGDSDDGKNSGG
ncbi:MAG: PAS domain S-box protein [Comamonadaceae bacterium]|nr:MAG: PAS domain S-box protein [Comamonadaceae bacterium]